jgi:polyisoprenoid-binding protein YceI
MKISSMILMAGAFVTLASCGGNTEMEEPIGDIEMKTLSLDTETSTLGWKGMKNATDSHSGSIKFSEGSAEFIDGNLTSGSFVVDMSKISVADQMPEEKIGMLIGHLSSPDFFDATTNAKVKVTCGAYMAGKLPVTITMSGKEISQEVPVTVTYADGKGSISGKFDVDFSALNATGFQPKEGEEDFVQPKVSFDLNLMLK